MEVCAIQVNDSLERVLKNTKTDTVRITLLNDLAWNYIETDPVRSEAYSKQAIDLSLKTGNRKFLASSIHNLGVFYYYRTNYPLALTFYIKALKIREDLHDTLSIAKSYNNIALIYEEENNLSLALQYYLKSLAIKLKYKDEKGLASAYGNLGNIYMKLGKQNGNDSLFEMSLIYNNRSLGYYRQLMEKSPDNEKFIRGVSLCNSNIGAVYYEMAVKNNKPKLLNEAMVYQEKALKYAVILSDDWAKARIYMSMAAVLDEKEEHDEAIKKYKEALAIIQPLGTPEELKTIYEGLSAAYEQKNDFQKGLDYYKLYTRMKDSVFNESTSSQIAEMQVKMDTDKKQKEIELLNKEKQISHTELEKEKLEHQSLIGGTVAIALVAVLVAALLVITLNRYRLKQKTNEVLTIQNGLIHQKNKEVTDSIRYAQRIQEAVLSPESQISKLLPESFVLYKPKDIVSGDFYWIEEWGNSILFAVADCTGHGVPGAFMSIVGNNLLNQAVNVYGLYRPFLILNYLNKNISEILNQTMPETSLKDGMDISLITIDKKSRKLEFSGSYNDLWIVRDNKLIELKADNFPIGAYITAERKSFASHEMDLKEGDVLYMFTDGYADQFGGPDKKSRDAGGKKFKYSRLRETLLQCHKQPMNTQQEVLNSVYENWKGELEQIDDVCMVGIRITAELFR